jgi:ADP-heptose:LPS heptosyltransferase
MKYKFYLDFDHTVAKTGLFSKLYNFFWGVLFFIKYGKPELVFRFGGGLGDHLLCSVLFHQLKKRSPKKIWMMSFYPFLFYGNHSVDSVVPDNWRVLKYCEKFNKSVVLLSYGKWFGDSDKIHPPEKHMITEIVEKADFHGKIELKPRFYSDSVSPVDGQYICIQGTNTVSSTPVRNKQWEHSKMNQISTWLSKKYTLIQIGLETEDRLEGTIDYREKVSICKLSSLLKDSLFFVGQEGFLMHLARTQDTRSVIIYGGRIKAWQSGYPCNENIESNPPCSPCWQNNHCDFNQKCMSDITVNHVVQGIKSIEKRLPDELETESVEL